MMRFLRIETLCFLICWLSLASVFRSRAFIDPGALWHVRVGDRILENGLMITDPFTFPFEGHTWIPQQWGGEVLMSLAHRFGGFDAMLQGFAIPMAMLFTWLFRRLMLAGMGWPLAGATVAAAIAAAGFHFYIRPHLITIAFTAITVGFLVEHDRQLITSKALCWLIPLHILWTNIHGGMLGGVVMLGLYSVLKSIQNRRFAWQLFAITTACALAMFVNPIGLELQRTWFRILGSKAMAQHVSEHMPLNGARPGDQAVLGFAILYGVLLLGTKLRNFRITWLLPIVWFILTVKSIRQGPLFVVSATVMIADIWPHTFWQRWLFTQGNWLTRPAEQMPLPLKFSDALFPGMFVVASLLLILSSVRVPVIGAGWAELPANVLPMDMVQPLRQHLRPGDRIYNDANFGGFLIYHFPDARIFMDDRFELSGDDWLSQYVETIDQHPERLENWFQTYQFRLALVASSNPPLPLETAMLASGNWSIRARGHNSLLMERVESKLK